MEWEEYLPKLIQSGKAFDDLTISLDEGNTKVEVPPIIRSSIVMLDKMIENQGHLNVIVFPERTQSIFIFTLMKLFHNIAVGKIEGRYSPEEFTPGEKLKVGNSIVEFVRLEEQNEGKRLILKLADANEVSYPIENCPIFQKVTTKRRLSRCEQFRKDRKKALESLENEDLTYAAGMKTHMDSSIFAMTSVVAAKANTSKCRINDKSVTELFYVAKTDYEGKLSNISPGQMSGVPAIVFASDLYAIDAATENGHPVQSIIIDGTNTNSLMDQLDGLDRLIALKVPIVCITDVANSFDLSFLKERGFNIWRWNQESITDQLYNKNPLELDRRIENCKRHKVEYLKGQGNEIGLAMRLLAKHRKETVDQSPRMMKLYEQLNALTFNAMRTTIPFSEFELDVANKELDESELIIKEEGNYISEESEKDYKETVSYLRAIYTYRYSFEKTKMVEELIKNHSNEMILLVVPERSDKKRIQEYWTTWCMRYSKKTRIRVMTPSEVYSYSDETTNLTVICGWLKRSIMRKLVFGYNTSQYIVLLYDYENRWKKHDVNRWEKALDNSSNQEIVKKSFSTGDISVSVRNYDKRTNDSFDNVTEDELNEIEQVLQENRYRRYVNSGNTKDVVKAIPINFVGGYLAFYRIGHKVVSATRIVMYDAEKIETKIPSELKIGDFIVVREADKDLVRDMADIILNKHDKLQLRELATKWREAIKIEMLFESAEDFSEKLVKAGCKKGLPTIKRWIEDEDVIAPREKEDLRIIAEATGNETLIELLDSIFEAAQEVRNAHVQAGRVLSEQLKRTLAQELKKNNSIDYFNFWEPIDMEIDGVGNVKVLKIIDIGSEVEMDVSNTNRLMED